MNTTVPGSIGQHSAGMPATDGEIMTVVEVASFLHKGVKVTFDDGEPVSLAECDGEEH